MMRVVCSVTLCGLLAVIVLIATGSAVQARGADRNLLAPADMFAGAAPYEIIAQSGAVSDTDAAPPAPAPGDGLAGAAPQGAQPLVPAACIVPEGGDPNGPDLLQACLAVAVPGTHAHANAAIRLAVAASLQERHADAVPYYALADAYPGDEFRHSGIRGLRARSLMLSGNSEAAVELARSVMEVENNRPAGEIAANERRGLFAAVDVLHTSGDREWAAQGLDFYASLPLGSAFEYRQRGLYYTRIDRFAQASADLQKALRQFGGDADVLRAYCFAMTQKGEAAQAMPYCNRAVRLTPVDSAAYFSRARAFASLDDCAASARDMEAARQFAPPDRPLPDFDCPLPPPDVSTIAQVPAPPDNLPPECTGGPTFVLEACAELAPEGSYIRFISRAILAEQARNAGDHARAVSLYEAADVRAFNVDAALYHRMQYALSLLELDRRDDAIILLDELRSLIGAVDDADLTSLQRSLWGEMVLAGKEIDWVYRDNVLARFKAMGGETVGDFLIRMSVFNTLEDYAHAAEAARQVVLLQPGDGASNNNYCWFLVLAGEAEKGLPYCAKSLRIQPDEWTALHSLAAAHGALGQCDKMEEAEAKARANMPDDAEWEDVSCTRQASQS